MIAPLICSEYCNNITLPLPFQVDYENEVLSLQIKDLMPEGKCIFIPIFLLQGYRGENANRY